MGKELLTISKREIQRVKVLASMENNLTLKSESEAINVNERQTYRIK